MKRKYRKEILRTGKWIHPTAPGGVLDVTRDYLNKLVENFSVTPFVPVLRGHVSNNEAEKNPSLILNKNIDRLILDGEKLYAEMEIDEKELDNYNDVSVSIDPEYINKETGKNVGAVLRHVAAVMNPYIKGMQGFMALSENEKNFLINLSEIQDMAKKDDLVETVAPSVELEEAIKEVVAETEEKKEEQTQETAVATEAVVEEESPKGEEGEEEPKKPEEEEPKTVEEEPKEEKVEASEDTAEQIKRLQGELESARLELSERDATDKYNALLMSGKILPSQKDVFIKLHKNVKGSIDLEDGAINLGDLLVKLLENNPVLVNLEEQGVVEVPAEDSEEEKIKTEVRALPVHAKKTDAEFAEYWDKNKKVYIEDYKQSKK